LSTLKYHIARFLLVIAAIQVLNMSVYPDQLQWQRSENLSSLPNEMDSFVEYVTEVVLGHENAFPEYAHKHHKDLQVHKQAISLYSEEVCNKDSEVPFILRSIEWLATDQYSYQYYNEINPPPPKA
jgi:hypothetical protein